MDDDVPAGTGRWVTTWTAMPQATEPEHLPPPPFSGPDAVLAGATLRQTVRASLGGTRLRLRFSNAFGAAELPLTRVAVALPRGGAAGVSAVEAGTSRPVAFGGAPGAVVPPGALVVSDPVDLDVAPGANLAVSVHLATGQAGAPTSHPGSRTTSHLAPGDRVEDADLPGAARVEHWYLLSAVEVLAPAGARAVVVLGDSLTDGRGSTTDGNDRWTDRLAERLRADPRTADVAVLNQGAGGNRVLRDGLGPSALARLDRDVLAHSGVEHLVVLEGVNDLGTAAGTDADQRAVTRDLVAALGQIAVRARARATRVHGATLLPFGGHEGYDDPAGHRERARQAVNAWIRTGGAFDAVVDLDAAVRDPADPRRLLPEADGGDHLHLGPTGYRVLADAVPLHLFGR